LPRFSSFFTRFSLSKPSPLLLQPNESIILPANRNGNKNDGFPFFKLAEVFRRRVIKLFVEKDLLQKSFAMKLLGWKHSGFSVDNSVGIPAVRK